MIVRLTAIFSCGCAVAPAHGLGLELSLRRLVAARGVASEAAIAQHDAAAVGLDGAEDQFQDAVEQLARGRGCG